jgi:V/A-type H+-transporting ATPase subunit I
VSSDKEQSRFALIYLKSRAEDVSAVLREYGFSAAQFRDESGTALELKNKAADRIEEIEGQIEELSSEIADMAPSRRDIELCIDRCTQEMMRETAKEHILVSGSVFAMEGWIDAARKDEAEEEIRTLTCAWEFTEPEEWDKVPTLLKNPKWMDPINVVTEMYSLPAYGTIDPNPLIFFTYVFFFGFMFADVAYGLIIFALSALIVKLYDPKGTMGRLFRLGKWLGISTAICGFFVGGFFGDVITTVNNAYLGGGALPTWLQAFCDGLVVNPMNDPLTVFMISLVIGALQLVYGQCVHIYLGFRDGHPIDYMLDVLPWWLTFAGIAVLAINGSAIVLILGVVSLICTQGRHKKGFFGKLIGGITSLYDITSWLSDILSYCRLMALMLATSVIASVANTLATLMQPPAGIILFVIVFVIFHAINIGINLIGTFVHAARLHYLEFFNKFYTTGGIPFKPLAYNTKYVNIIEEEK